MYQRLDYETGEIIKVDIKGLMNSFKKPLKESERHIAKTDIKKDGIEYSVSTIFLYIQHPGYMNFETMIFCGNENDKYNDFQIRYRTMEEAKAGHDKIVKMVENGEYYDEI